jgi:hypothetical protein
MKFREPLPPQCPPPDAEEVSAVRLVYRLVESYPPSNGDFASQRAMRPEATFQVDECMAHGLSVHAVLDDSRKAARLPNLRGRFPCLIRLSEGAGFIQQTGKWSHHTWWPLASFDILSCCEELSS